MQTLLCSVICLFSFSASAQFLQVTDVVTGPYNPQNLISNVFLGEGVEVTNVQFTGDPRAVGYFSGGTQSIGIERGILLTTGFSLSATDDGGTQASDGNIGGSVEASLLALLPPPAPGNPQLTLEDVAVYTITFVPNSDTLRFRYCFASEEYPEYACSQFNDVFGFFIQGPGYPTFTNIAKIPGSNQPVSINNIHPANPIYANCFDLNVQYYNDNEDSSVQPVYDGFTDPFTAIAVVTPCQPYTIKLAICDVGDSAYDSGVFLEAKSFGTGSLQVGVSTVSADATIAEGCDQGMVTFTLPEIRAQNYNVNFNVFGTATAGADYQAIPANLVIPAGQNSITVPIVAIQDNITEPLESIGISVQVDPCNRDTVYLYIRDKILQAPMMADTSVCLPNTPITLNATVPTPVPAPPTFTNQTDYNIPNGGAPVNSSISVVGVQPPIVGPGVIRSVCINVQHTWIDDVDAYLISPNGIVLELTTDNGGNGDNYTSTCFTPVAGTVISSPGPFAPATAAPFTGDWQPEGVWSDIYGEPTNGNWRLRLTDDQNNINGTLLDWTITFEPSYDVTYQWSPASGLSCTDCAMPVATIGQSSTYSVTATDSYGCTVTDNVDLSIGQLSTTAQIVQPIKCFGQKGTISASAPGNNTFLWSGGQTTASVNNLGPGTYTVTVTSTGANCSATASVTLTQPTELFATASPHNVTCFGLTTGTFAVYPSGGVEPYNFQWSNGPSVADSIFNLAPGTYTVTVTDGNGCTETATSTINEPANIQIITALNRSPSCFGLTDGQVTTYATGGTTPFTFVWNTGQVNQALTNIGAGTYTVTATDGNGCSQVKMETVTEPLLLTSVATPEPVKCFGQNSGKLHLEANGGTPNYTITWTGPNGFTGSGANLNNIAAGTYNATVTDTHNCTSTLTVNVDQPAELQLSLPEISDTICFFASNGVATLGISGGNSPYSYAWDANGQTAQSAVGLASNEYHVTVTDANGCTGTAKTFIAQQQELNTYAEAVAPGCHDGTDGTAKVLSIYYGATPANVQDFDYRWGTNPPQFGINANNLQGGQTYIVTATDALGCTATATIEVDNPFPIETAITGSGEVKCHGDATGWAAAKAIGGTAPYKWFWNGGSTPADSLAQGLPAGTYRVTITDVFGCPGISTVTIEEPTQLRVQIAPTNVKCFGESTGSAIATPSGGVGPYQYVWANGTQSAQIQGLAAGVYTMSVQDANGCTTPASVTIAQPEMPLSGTAAMEMPHCFGAHDGRIIISPAGGTPPYQYGLDNKPFNGSPIQIGIKAGDYTPKLLDRNGCTFLLEPITVTQPLPISVDLGPDIQLVFGQDTQLLALVTDGQAPYTFTWADLYSEWLNCLDCPDPRVTGLEFPTYFEVLVKDSLGCSARDKVLITVEKPRKVHVPTGFTPNADFNNDLLLVHGQKETRVLDFKVYDRWGEMVFELKDFAINDETQGWDGTFRGQPCDPGVYVWVLEVEYVDGVKEAFKGNTTLIR